MDGTETKKEAAVRPPIVVVMGHVDHGKTTMLDWYRKTSVAAGETGGITQHIGAYEIEYKGKRITFLDTPGHEAFSKMRSRGARVADIAILVVAADEGVKPQTKEAIAIIKEAGVPFAVALNKIDKPGANAGRVLQELAENEVLVEGYGGKTPSAEVSARTGHGMEDLLDVVLLLADLERLELHPDSPGRGVVIETHRDPRRGITATLLLQDGAIELQDAAAIGGSAETIKILENFAGERIRRAVASSPVRTAGLAKLPEVGDTFAVCEDKAAAEKQAAAERERRAAGTKQRAAAPEEGAIVFNVILKADVAGSREALEDEIKKLATEKVGVTILKSEVGDVGESDVKLAAATKLVTIVGFRVKTDASATELADNLGIRIITGEIIYELLDELKRLIAAMTPASVTRVDLGRAKVLKLFKRDGARQVVGGRVDDGVIRKDAMIEIRRGRAVAGTGEIRELQQNRQAAAEVAKGSEFGVMINSDTPIEAGDVLAIFAEEKTA